MPWAIGLPPLLWPRWSAHMKKDFGNLFVCMLPTSSWNQQRWKFMGGLSEGSSATYHHPILPKPRSRYPHRRTSYWSQLLRRLDQCYRGTGRWRALWSNRYINPPGSRVQKLEPCVLFNVEVSLKQQVHTYHKPYDFQVREGQCRCFHLTRPSCATRLTCGSHMPYLLVVILCPQL